MTSTTVEFRTQTSNRGERVFIVEQEDTSQFLLYETDTAAEPTELTVNEHRPGIYELSTARETAEPKIAMLANAAFQSIAVADNVPPATNVFALVETGNFIDGHEHTKLYEKTLGMTAVAMTRQGNEVILLGGNAQEVNGNATWTLHDSNIYRATAHPSI